MEQYWCADYQQQVWMMMVVVVVMILKIQKLVLLCR
jgi:maltodextrin utilization protein YvdJ